MSNEIATVDSAKLTQLQANLEKMQPDKTVNIAADYWKPEPGEETRVIFTGMSEMKKMNGKDGEMVEAIMLLTKDGLVKNADKVLVSTFRDKTPGFAALVVCKGKKKGSAGEYKEFDVFPLS